MVNLLKSNFIYYFKHYILFFLILPSYTIFVLSDKQILSGPEWEIDYWGGIFAMAIYLLYFTIIFRWFKERRDRQLNLIPLNITKIAIVRCLLLVFPMIIVCLYLVVLHLVIIKTWRLETESSILQIGITFLLIVSFAIIWDQWNKNYDKKLVRRIRTTAIMSIIFLIYLVGGFLFLRTYGYQILGNQIGKLVFVIQTVLILPLLFHTFRKRGNFLN